mmetsp:Transcript_752/g.1197  ORF Transcript_752/g.1197 Transcript_752/m.1197 type:complete len:196 (-) Transcript_752:779-1366(-)
MLKRSLKRLRRWFSEDPFKDSEGRFKTRWDSNYRPEHYDYPKHEKLQSYPVQLDKRTTPRPERIFDFILPPDINLLDSPVQIWSIADGFFSVNQVWVPGPLVVFPEGVFQWNVKRPEDIREHHLEVMSLISPKIEYVIIGTGKIGYPLHESIRGRYMNLGINVDWCPTFEACGTFNLAADDGRRVCAFLLNPDVE